jgi:hypothetical protein
MTHDLSAIGGKRVLFWDDLAGELQPLLDLLNVVPGGRKYGQPKDHIHRDVPWADREDLSVALQLKSPLNQRGGDVLMGYMGRAKCRICGHPLGSRDLFGHGFMWPEKAEHYVIVHHVWTPECTEMLAVVRQAWGKAR